MIAKIAQMIGRHGSPVVVDGTLVFNHPGNNNAVQIRSAGKENVLILPRGGMTGQLVVDFRSSHSCIHIGTHTPKIHVTCGYGCVLAVLPGTTFTSLARFTLAEGKDVIVGRECMFAGDVIVSNTDGHPIFDFEGNRLNIGQDIIIGHHVWLGRSANVMKGAFIDSGAIVGAHSVVTGSVPPHTVVAGVPARPLREGVIFSRKTTVRQEHTTCPEDEKMPPPPMICEAEEDISLARSVYR